MPNRGNRVDTVERKIPKFEDIYNSTELWMNIVKHMAEGIASRILTRGANLQTVPRIMTFKFDVMYKNERTYHNCLSRTFQSSMETLLYQSVSKERIDTITHKVVRMCNWDVLLEMKNNQDMEILSSQQPMHNITVECVVPENKLADLEKSEAGWVATKNEKFPSKIISSNFPDEKEEFSMDINSILQILKSSAQKASKSMPKAPEQKTINPTPKAPVKPLQAYDQNAVKPKQNRPFSKTRSRAYENKRHG